MRSTSFALLGTFYSSCRVGGVLATSGSRPISAKRPVRAPVVVGSAVPNWARRFGAWIMAGRLRDGACTIRPELLFGLEPIVLITARNPAAFVPELISQRSDLLVSRFVLCCLFSCVHVVICGYDGICDGPPKCR